MPIVTLLTDFGTRDYYVSALKGVILSIAPHVRLVDITHEVEPHNILHGAFILRYVWPWYPAGTIHLAIVDPGVGPGRRVILGEYAGRYVIAPDNGLVTLLHREVPAGAMFIVENRRFFGVERSATFQGRDIMAPVAAHLASGVSPSEVGPVLDDPEMLSVADRAQRSDRGLTGKVLYVDRFGTMVTNVRAEQLEGSGEGGRGREVFVNGTSVGPIRSTFADVSQGDPVALMGSCGLLEIAVNQGRAVDRFGLPGAATIEVR